MFTYFDKTFFKFLFGFLVIIFISFVVTGLAVKDVNDAQKASPETASLIEFSD